MFTKYNSLLILAYSIFFTLLNSFQLAIHASDQPYTVDDDTKLEFYWDPAVGNVEHYNIYLAVYDKFGDEKSYVLIEKTKDAIAPTEENPYTVPISAEDGKKYELKVQAETSIAGPMSEPSVTVWCKLRSLGDIDGPMPGDADGDQKVDISDLGICINAWGSKRDDKAFDYRADLNYDDSVDILDLVIAGRYLQQEN